MNVWKRELLSYRKQTMYWCIGMLVLIIIAFYKVSSMNSTPGGVEAMLNSLPSFLQAFFKAGSVDYTTAVGTYSMIHLYMAIALALHAVLLGSTIFAKEEQDKTYEFLYVKGMKRWKILMIKIFSGLFLLLLLDLVCVIGIYVATMSMQLSLVFKDLMPYIASLCFLQLFFFALALLLSIALPNSQKAGMLGCCIVFVMFMISMYVKVGGNIDTIERLSLFHYADSSYIAKHGYGGFNSFMIVGLSLICFSISEVLHERRDLL